MKYLHFLFFIFFSLNLMAQERSSTKTLPDLPGYITLQCDLHTHSAFSDGKVWPSIRTEEAIREGLDCLGITEHLEYLPHQGDLPPGDRDRAYEIANEVVGDSDLMVFNGVEITRGMPPGHSTAVFVKDANELILEDVTEVYEAAKAQGAFIFNNHPDLFYQRSNAIARFEPLHIEYIKRGLIQGLEVANLNTFSEEALQLALEHDLTLIGSSDLHTTSDREFDIQNGGHRTSTLVFAKDRSEDELKEALINGRTIVRFKDQFIGRGQWLIPFLKESVSFKTTGYQQNTVLLGAQVTNHTDTEFILLNKSSYSFYNNTNLIIVPAFSTIDLQIKTVEKVNQLSLHFEVLNAITAPDEHPTIVYELEVD